MLFKFKDELQGAAIHTPDGRIGSVQDLHFGDHDWVVRYLVLDTGTWLPGRLVVISPASIERFDRDDHGVHVNLTREQIENSPSLDLDQAILPHQEAALADYYGWPLYGVPAPGPVPPVTGTLEQAKATRLRSAREVTGYYIHAQDGDIGHVDDFILEDYIWTVRYLAIDTRNWWPGKKVLIAPTWIREVDWANTTVQVDLPKEAIRSAPEYSADVPIHREYEAELWSHYAWAPYWKD